MAYSVAGVLSDNIEPEEFLNPSSLRPVRGIKRNIRISFLSLPLGMFCIIPSEKVENPPK